MRKDNYISEFKVNLDKVIDYIFHDIAQSEENRMEEFLDNHEELAMEIENLLDFCLEQNINKFMVKLFVKSKTAPALNEILDGIENRLEKIALEAKMVQDIITIEKMNVEVSVKSKKRFKAGKRFLKVAFTLLLVLNLPFWQSYTGDANSSLLKASQREKVQQMMTLSAYEIQNMRVDMLDERPITDFMTIVAIPSTFELRYVTED